MYQSTRGRFGIRKKDKHLVSDNLQILERGNRKCKVKKACETKKRTVLWCGGGVKIDY
jgi:hypothetical protein